MSIMYSVTVKDHIMIAHSLPDDFFGPAKNMHGATYNVDATFKSETLNDKNVVIDIGLAAQSLNEVLGKLNYQNLDELPQFQGILTTTEFLAKYIHDRLAEKVGSAIRLKIELWESHVASAAYEA
ncbi:MAG: 6-carboxytetrahydropterin synthase [Roseivirga sp.]